MQSYNIQCRQEMIQKCDLIVFLGLHKVLCDALNCHVSRLPPPMGLNSCESLGRCVYRLFMRRRGLGISWFPVVGLYCSMGACTIALHKSIHAVMQLYVLDPTLSPMVKRREPECWMYIYFVICKICIYFIHLVNIKRSKYV